jgi:hypothetical protein
MAFKHLWRYSWKTSHKILSPRFGRALRTACRTATTPVRHRQVQGPRRADRPLQRVDRGHRRSLCRGQQVSLAAGRQCRDQPSGSVSGRDLRALGGFSATQTLSVPSQMARSGRQRAKQAVADKTGDGYLVSASTVAAVKRSGSRSPWATLSTICLATLKVAASSRSERPSWSSTA